LDIGITAHFESAGFWGSRFYFIIRVTGNSESNWVRGGDAILDLGVCVGYGDYGIARIAGDKPSLRLQGGVGETGSELIGRFGGL
jgi:hypothetical protein